MQDISGFGLIVTVAASNTFPSGFNVTQFADDADPLDSASIALADKAMGLNGDLITWSKAVPVPLVLNVIPGSDDDANLSVLADNNRVGRGKNGARDVITITVFYPNGATALVTQGKLMEAQAMNSVASAGRQKTKMFSFSFENIVRTAATNL